MRIQEVRELSFNYFICLSVIRLFFYASFCRVGRFRFRGDNGVGFRTNKVYEKNTLWTQYSRKIFIRTAYGSTLFVREEPVNTFEHVTKMTDSIECIISQWRYTNEKADLELYYIDAIVVAYYGTCISSNH